MDTSYITLEV